MRRAAAALLGALPPAARCGWSEDIARTMTRREELVAASRDVLAAELAAGDCSTGGGALDMCAGAGARVRPHAKFPGVPVAAAVGFKWQDESRGGVEECAAAALEARFAQNLEEVNGTKWQYYGSQRHGFIANYPALKFDAQKCRPSHLGGYDPRYRQWYAAAAAGPKDIVLVLDTSGSMCLDAASAAQAAAAGATSSAELDRFGNPVGSEFDLAKDGAFEGHTVAVLQVYSGEKFDFTLPTTALGGKGFQVLRWDVHGQTPPAAWPTIDEFRDGLDRSCQLWVISDSETSVPGAFLDAIQEFFDSGRGVYLWGDNDPYHKAANEVAARLFGGGVQMSGNDHGDKVISERVGDRVTTAGFQRHDVTTGLNNIYEGITIARIDVGIDPPPERTGGSEWGPWVPLATSTHGHLVSAAYDDGARRAVFDGGFTRLFYKWDSAGTPRFVKNVAAWLCSGCSDCAGECGAPTPNYGGLPYVTCTVPTEPCRACPASRLSAVKDAAVAVLDTLSFTDFVQVVAFSDGARSEGASLVRATAANKQRLRAYINGLCARGGTNFNAGFERAFDILRASGGSGCRRAISFLTDGHAPDPSANVSAWNAELRERCGSAATIFSYSLGTGSDTEVPRRLSCASGGLFYSIPDGEAACLKRAMAGYFELFARRADFASAAPRWSEMYCDGFGLGEMTTVAIPVFTPDPDSGAGGAAVLAGVLGVDVMRSEFTEGSDPSETIEVALLQESQSCAESCVDAPTWRRLRAAAESMCGGPAAAAGADACDPPPAALCPPAGASRQCTNADFAKPVLDCRPTLDTRYSSGAVAQTGTFAAPAAAVAAALILLA